MVKLHTGVAKSTVGFITIEIRKKVRHHDLNELVISFNEELLNYATYKVQSEKNKGIREMLLQRVLVILL